MKKLCCCVLLGVLNSFKLSGMKFGCFTDMFLNIGILRSSVTAVLIMSAVALMFRSVRMVMPDIFTVFAVFASYFCRGMIWFFGLLYICGLAGADKVAFSPGSAEIFVLAFSSVTLWLTVAETDEIALN